MDQSDSPTIAMGEGKSPSRSPKRTTSTSITYAFIIHLTKLSPKVSILAKNFLRDTMISDETFPEFIEKWIARRWRELEGSRNVRTITPEEEDGSTGKEETGRLDGCRITRREFHLRCFASEE